MVDVKYDSGASRNPVVDEFHELWRYRSLLRLLVINSIKTRYRRSVLGVIWTLLNPLLNTIVLTIAYSALFRFDLENYAIYLLAGFLLWNFFAQTTTASMNTLVWGSNLLRRIYIPRTIFAFSAVGNGLVNFILSLIPLLIVTLVMKHPVTPAVFFLFFSILLTAMFTLGVSLLLSTLAIFFVDIVDMYSVILSTLFFLTPIIYPISIIPPRYVPFIQWNPINIFLELFRFPVYYGVLPPLKMILAGTIIALGSLWIGWWFFTKRVDEFAYRI